MENTKRDLSLDFTKPRHPRGGQTAPSLVTPILNLSTPELNKMISEDELAVLTPNGISSVIPQSNVLPSPLIPTTVNCNNIINNHNNNSTTNHGSQNTSVNPTNNLQNSNKRNAVSHNGSQNQNHNGQNHKKRSDKGREVDVDKIEKKRERNRLAAKKCRQRKLETIEDLRKTVSEWEEKYQNLQLAFEDFKNVRTKELETLRRDNAELKSLLAMRQ